MIINSIALENFRQYKGRTKIEFCTGGEKNVTVIIGQNTCGKTTLVRAFIWCLYGKVAYDKNQLLNAEVEEELLSLGIGNEKKLSVEIDLIHNGKRCLIKRTQSKELRTNGKMNIVEELKIYDYENGAWTPSNCKSEYEMNDKINAILPFNLSDYFFFWGERIETLGNKRNISSAVKDFLGLTTLDKVKKHLKLSIDKFNESLANKDRTDNLITSYRRKIDKLKSENEQYNIELKEKEKEKEYFEDKYKQLEDELLSDSNKEIAQKQKELKRAEEQLKKETAQLAEKNRKFIRVFNNQAVSYFAQFASKQAIKLLNEQFDNSDEGWININIKTIEEILKKGRCICDTEVIDGNDAYNKLTELKKYVAPNYIVPLVESFKADCSVRNKWSKSYYQNLVEVYKEIENIRSTITDLNGEIKDLEKETTGTLDMEEKRSRMLRFRSKYEEYFRNCTKLNTLIESNEKEIENLNKKMQTYVSTKDKHDSILMLIKYSQKVLDNINDEYIEKEKEIKQQLQIYVSKYFSEMYTGNRNVEIDENFKIQAYNYVNGKKLQSEGSPGLETVKNFAFIAGLVQIAKDIVSNKDTDKIYLSSEPYPLVLDAPFSQADDEHVPAISSLITKIAEQTILVVMQKDWNYAKNDMKDKVGKFYRLRKESETHTVVELVEEAL